MIFLLIDSLIFSAKRSTKTEDKGKGTIRKDSQYRQRVPIILLKIKINEPDYG